MQKRYVILYVKEKTNKIVGEVTVDGDSPEECLEKIHEHISEAFVAEEINAEVSNEPNNS